MTLERVRALQGAASTLILALLLGSGALAAWPEGVRIVLAFLALVLLPGEGWRRAIGAPSPGGGVLAAGLALGFGVAWAGGEIGRAHV